MKLAHIAYTHSVWVCECATGNPVDSETVARTSESWKETQKDGERRGAVSERGDRL